MTNQQNGRTTASWIEGLKEGKADVWNAFVPRYGAMIYHLFRKFGLDPKDWEDVMQDIILRVFAKISGFIPKPENPSLRPWLYFCVRSAVVDQQRKNNRQPFLLDESQLNRLSQELAGEFEALIEEDWRAYVLAQVLERFPETHRNVVDLLVKGKTPDEVATELSISKGTVNVYKSKFLNAIEEIKKELGLSS